MASNIFSGGVCMSRERYKDKPKSSLEKQPVDI